MDYWSDVWGFDARGPMGCDVIPAFPRPCVVTSNQFHLEGLCWCLTPQGMAIVEDRRGECSRYDLTYVHSIKFTDIDHE